jgi:hypothetical protein
MLCMKSIDVSMNAFGVQSWRACDTYETVMVWYGYELVETYRAECGLAMLGLYVETPTTIGNVMVLYVEHSFATYRCCGFTVLK